MIHGDQSRNDFIKHFLVHMRCFFKHHDIRIRTSEA
jgi:hypothetical protein